MISQDIEHLFVISTAICRDGTTMPADGYVAWTNVAGIKFKVRSIGYPSWDNPRDGSTPGVGKLQSSRISPIYVLHSECGARISLFGVNSQGKWFEDDPDFGSRSEFTHLDTGKAHWADVILPPDHPLAFQHETPIAHRIAISDFDCNTWSAVEPVSFTRGETTYERNQCWIGLDGETAFRIYAGWGGRTNSRCSWAIVPFHDSRYCWSSKDANSAFSFWSLIIGKGVWRRWEDRFLENGCIDRTYYHPLHRSPVASAAFAPYPLTGFLSHTIEHGTTAIKVLPELWTAYQAAQIDFDINWILGPLQLADSGFLDDRLSLASLSLERFASAWQRRRRRLGLPEPITVTFSDGQLKELHRRFDIFLDGADQAPLNLTEDQLRHLERKRNDLFRLANADKLRKVFEDIGIRLSDREIHAIKFRNKPLHGVRTLSPDGTMEDRQSEVDCYDALRSLIYKGMFLHLGYRGPFIDFAARPNRGEFPVIMLGN